MFQTRKLADRSHHLGRSRTNIGSLTAEDAGNDVVIRARVHTSRVQGKVEADAIRISYIESIA